MRRFVPPVPRRASIVRLFFGITVAVGLALTTISAQIPGRNINMVSGNVWPQGDPYLQRQNEPSIGASTRNPLHLLAGSNDYRTVDLPGLAEDETGDAWLGLFKSYDGGQRWTSTLLPGYPQDGSAAGLSSPIKGYGAGADPVVRAGTNGLMYYAGLAFNRPNPATPDIPGKSAIFVARFIDNNNKEAGDTFEYLGTRALQTDPGGATGNFLDKPWMVVDIPRDNTRCTIVTPGANNIPITQSVPAGPVYVAYTLRSTDNKGARYDVMFTRSADCGNTWTAPVRLNDNSERANQGAAMAIDPRNGNVYIAWRQFDLSANGNGTDALMTVKFTLSGKKLAPPGFARKFAKPKKGKGKGLDPNHFYKKGGVNKALEAAELSPLDQSTSATQIRFRTNAYPTMVIDETGRIYMAWAERGYDPLSPDPVLGSARVLMATSMDGGTWTTAKPVNNNEAGQKGHQLMPSITYAGGKLMLIYYDIRETRSKAFTQYIDDKTAFSKPDPVESTGLRHTIDLRASMASPGAVPVFAPSVAVSEYIEGPRFQDGPNVPWQVNPPNLPMFQKGTAPFIGDYVDITAAPNFVINAAGKWVYNSTAGSTPPIFHAAWTDNRDVRVPRFDTNGDGNFWNDYAPPTGPGGLPSIFDPSKVVPECVAGNAGSRNQNIYTARITGGLLVGSPGNTKHLGFREDEDGNPTTQLMERSFVVFAQNTAEPILSPADATRRFRFTITNQPAGGRASFDQFSPAPLTSIDADIPYRSTASRTVYATSTDPHAVINVSVAELVFVNGVWVVKTGGLGSVIILNPDIDNPDIDNPDIDNPDIDNPDIDNAEVYNPDIDNPDIDNPDIDNPDIDNPDIDNPDIDNIRVANPDIDNPDIDNPDIDNPDIDNPDIDNPDIDNPDIDNGALMSDVSWAITNTGNTTASYNVNLFFAQQTFDSRITTQLILYRTYKTPVVQNCDLKSETRNVLVANVPNPQLVTGSTGGVSNPNDSSATNATIYLAPGESAKITLRVFDPAPPPGSVVAVTNPDNSVAYIPSQFVPNEDVTPVVQQQSVNTEDVDQGVTEPPIVVQFPPPQTVDDAASTAENTPVTINPLANDSTAFGSTKVLSFHPAGMAAHSGGGTGDLAFQPSTGFLYTQRGAVDPATDALVGRFAVPPGGFGIASQRANPRTGINYGRTGATNATLTALDARPDSSTFHQYLTMPILSDAVLALALDTTHGRLYAAHGPQTPSTLTPTTLSVIDIVPGSATFHQVIASVALPAGVRTQSVAVNSRTQKVYLAESGTQGAPANVPGGVFVIDMNAAVPTALRIPNTTQGAFSLVVNESANLIFATTNVGQAAVYAIDGASTAVALIPVGGPFRFGSNDERLALHEASGKVFYRLESAVVVIDGQRGSPTRNTVLSVINVGRENGGTDIAVDQELGLVVTVGSYDFQADIIDVASNALATTIPLSTYAQDVAIDPVHHRAFLAVFTYVQEVELAPISLGAAIPVFIESGSILLNPELNKAYAGLFTTNANIEVMSGAGFEGALAGALTQGRYLYSEWHKNTKRGFMINQGNSDGTGSEPGGVMVVDGVTEDVLGYVDVLPGPFGIGIDQVNDKIYVASLSSPFAHGGVTIIDDPDVPNPEMNTTQATFTTGVNAAYPAFPLQGTGTLLGFGRYVVANPVNHKVYTLQMNTSSAASLAVIDPVTSAMKPLDGAVGSPLFTAANPAACGGASQPVCVSWGRVNVIRVIPSLNRVYLGLLDTNNVGRIVALDSATDTVVGSWVGGSHGQRHTASFLAVNEGLSRLYVTDYTNNVVTMLDASTLLPITTTALPGGPSATAVNEDSDRLYVSSIDSKTIYAIDGTTLQIVSSVRMPLTAYFLWVDPVESRIYTSGGDSADESGAMVITDVLGQLGTNVSVTSVGSATKGTTSLDPANGSVTYTPFSGQFGPDSFSYTIAAPTGTAIGTVNINIVPSMPAAVAFGDGYNAVKNQLLTVAAPGPLANDATGGSPTTMVVDDTTDFGTLTPNDDGSFTYQPNLDFTGVDTFQYHAVTDSLGATNPVTVTITVTSPTSLVVINTNDSGAGSLRQALTIAAVEPGSTITFNIPGAGPHTISPLTQLPSITTPTTIDGYLQPGASPNTAFTGTNAVIKIQLRGNLIPGPSITDGLRITGGGTTVRGLAIGNFTSAGIFMDAVGGNTIEGNFVGTDASGMNAFPNGNPPTPPNTNPSGAGITSRSPANTIGGTAPGARNLISGNLAAGIRADSSSSSVANGAGTTILNNLVGTNATGNVGLPNGPPVVPGVSGNGIVVTVPNVTIGGTSLAARNVISGNNGTGISSFASTFGSPNPQTVVSVPTNLTIQGNYIGIKADGSGALANIGTGISVAGQSLIGGSVGTTPGGACTGACNVIAGNNSGVNIGVSTDNTTQTVTSSADGSVVEGNFVGLSPTGTAAFNNGGTGISVNAPNVRIGGTTPEQRNVIAGNGGTGINLGFILYSGTGTVAKSAAGATITGNYIGLTSAGTSSFGNSTGISLSVPNVRIGGSVAERNVISGSINSGINASASTFDPDGNGPAPQQPLTPSLVATGLQITNNYVGTSATGNTALSNGGGGMNLSAPGVQVRNNVISGNGNNALTLGAHTSSTGQVWTSGAGAIVTGNLIGVNASAGGMLPNQSSGISISVPGVTIGGPSLSDRNLISGNGGTGINAFAQTFDPDGNGPAPQQPVSPVTTAASLMVQGNYIGTNSAGNAQFPNNGGGISVSAADAVIGGLTGTTPGGPCTGACNLISGNFGTGLNLGTHFDNTNGTVWATSSNAQVIGNYIGVNASGNGGLANSSVGLNVSAASPTITNNVVAGNGGSGISLGNNYVTATSQPVSSANGAIVQSNYVGVNAAGGVLLANGGSGISMGVQNATIGGNTPALGNLVASATGFNSAINVFRAMNGATQINAGDTNTIAHNVVGLNAAHTGRFNGGSGIFVQTADNQILNNTVAGNGVIGVSNPSSNGITLYQSFATGNQVKGNIVGTNEFGDAGLGNTARGIVIQDASNNVIGGTNAADRNIVVDNRNFGISFDGTTGPTSNNVVQGNYIGVKADGSTVLANSSAGINMYANSGATITLNTIGGSTAAARNVIAGNTGDGLSLGGGTNGNVNNNTIAGNYIGVGADGVTALGNGGNGVFITNATDNTIGGPNAADGNLIANSFFVGVGLNAQAVRNRILSNRISASGGLGIDLNNNGITSNDPGDTDGGANNGQNFPVLTSVDNSGATTKVNVDASTFSVGNYTVQIFANAFCDGANGEGSRFVGSGTIVQPGGQIVLNEVIPSNEVLTGTATDANGNTSEFSTCLSASAQPTLVTNTNDSGSGSLRAAITYANATAGAQVITFNIGGVNATTPGTIALTSALPSITDAVTIDGTTQPGYSNAPLVELNGFGAGAGAGLTIQSPSVVVRALAIGGFSSHGIALTGNDFILTGSYIGVRPDGVTARPNGVDGVSIVGSNNTIGGTSANLRNVISANSRDGVRVQSSNQNGNVILGNYIGLNAAGTAAMGNVRNGVTLDQSNTVTVGGSAGGAMNVISGNGQHGVDVFVCDPGLTCNGHVIEGNRIGTNNNGTVAIANAQHGIRIESAPNNIIRNNLISGNTLDGVNIHGVSLAHGNQVIVGNLIGTTATGNAALGNQGDGVQFIGILNSRIGGPNVQDRNVVAWNQGVGVYVNGALDTVVQGNYVGVPASGNGVAGNGNTGVLLDSNAINVTVGGATPNLGNVISNNGNSGVVLWAAVHDNVVRNNIIGWDATGSIASGNTGNGVRLDANNNVIQDNRIGNSTLNGVSVVNGTGNKLSANRITSNGTMGIDLGNNADQGPTLNDNGDGDTGANNLQNYPVLTNVSSSGNDTTVVGTLNSTPNSSFTMEFFLNSAADPNGFGEGAQYLAMLPATTDNNGNFSFAAPMQNIVTAPGQWVSATATNNITGDTSEFSLARQVDSNLVVVSNQDSGAGSLRAAMTYANATPGRETIRFNIPDASTLAPAVIGLASPLPIITSSLAIDATTQPGYDGKPLIEIDGQNAVPNGFETQADIYNTFITGFAITRFTNAGIFLMQTDSSPGGGSQVMNNFIGTDRFGAGGKGNNTGVVVRGDNSFISTNVISGNTQVGVRLENDADSVVVTSNKIGVMQDGVTAQPNGADGIRMYDSLNNNVISSNIIAKNNGWGINIQDSLAGDVSGTMIYGNTIGLDANGNIAGNFGGGVRVENGPGTDIGLPGDARNVISGNGGPNPPDIGVGIQVIGPGGVNIRNNYIGLDPTGVFARSNNNKGIVMDGPATIGGANANDRNYISGNGDAAGGAGIIVGPGVPNGSSIAGNVIGLNVNGQAVGNGYAGITVRSQSALSIGANIAATANVISGNGSYGISIVKVVGTDAPSNVSMEFNRIGTDDSGTLSRPNGLAGINVSTGTGHRIGGNGHGNLIAFNGSQGGVRVTGATTQVRIQENLLHTNTGLGIDLNADGLTTNDGAADGDSGPNGLQNFPPLVSAENNSNPTTLVTFSANDFNPGVQHTIEFFSSVTCDSSGHGEGQTFQGSTVVTGGQGPAVTFLLNSVVPVGHQITATATDPFGNTSEFSNCAEVGAVSTVVSNTDDNGSGSLRAALTAANNTPGAQTITFSIPNVSGTNPATIALNSPLPVITGPVTLDAMTQPGYDNKPVIELSGQNTVANGFETATDVTGVTIRGFAITRFTHAGVFLLQSDSAPGSYTVANNYIGVNRAAEAGTGNVTGILTRGDFTYIVGNVISGNTGAGIVIENDADNVTLQQNTIGMLDGGLTPRGNGTGVVIYGSVNDATITDNMISANTGWGIDVQPTASQVTGTVIRRNVIGLNQNVEDAGNGIGNPPGGGGGVRVTSAPGTVIGGPNSWRNIISGNGGPNPSDPGVGILIQGSANPMPVIQSNVIGLEPSVQFARSNNTAGIVLDGPAQVGGGNANEGNYISGNGTLSDGGTGIRLTVNAGGSAILGNVIGLNQNNDAVGNGRDGITVASTTGSTIGSSASGAGNIISGNGRYGILIIKEVSGDPEPANTVIEHNFIGTDGSGSGSRPNGHTGIYVFDGSGHRIGGNSLSASNTIAFNGGAGNSGGVVVAADARVRIQQNSIHSNYLLGIDLAASGVTANDALDADIGANMQQNFVTMTSAVTTGSQNTDVVFDTTPLVSGNLFTVEFFANNACDASGHGEGYAFAGSRLVSGGSGNITFALGLSVAPGQFITATATDAAGNTSEFSNCVTVSNGSAPIVNSVEPSTTFASGQMVTLLGSNFQAAGGGSVIIRSGSNDYPGSYLWYNNGSKLIVRTGTGAPSGPAQLIAKNGATESAPIAITIQSQSAAPLFKHMFNGNCSGYGGDPQNPVDTSSSWSGGDLFLVAAGIDTIGTKVLFTPTGGGPPVQGSVVNTCAWALGDQAVHVQVPALPPGNYDVTMRTSSGGTESVDSSAKPLTINTIYLNAVSGGAANGNCTWCSGTNPPGPGPFPPQAIGTVKSGQQITISASGTAWYSPSGSVGPQGLGPGCGSDCLAPGLLAVGLIGRFAGGAWFDIGAGGTFVNSGPAGYLELAMNDTNFVDNSGGWTVIVSPQ